MTDKERHAYDAHMDDIMVQNDVLDTAKMEGRAEGLAEGLAEGRAEGLAEGMAKGHEKGLAEGREAAILAMARRMKEKGMPLADIAEMTGLSVAELEK